jgi:hypothetical protein
MIIKSDSVFIAAFFFIIVLVANTSQADRLHPEKYYQMQWCFAHGGMVGVELPEETRCDCVTESHVIEIQFAEKWADAIGRSLHYSLISGKIAGIVLILASESDHKYWNLLNSTIEKFELPIETWEIYSDQ